MTIAAANARLVAALDAIEAYHCADCDDDDSVVSLDDLSRAVADARAVLAALNAA